MIVWVALVVLVVLVVAVVAMVAYCLRRGRCDGRGRGGDHVAVVVMVVILVFVLVIVLVALLVALLSLFFLLGFVVVIVVLIMPVVFCGYVSSLSGRGLGSRCFQHQQFRLQDRYVVAVGLVKTQHILTL